MTAWKVPAPAPHYHSPAPSPPPLQRGNLPAGASPCPVHASQVSGHRNAAPGRDRAPGLVLVLQPGGACRCRRARRGRRGRPAHLQAAAGRKGLLRPDAIQVWTASVDAGDNVTVRGGTEGPLPWSYGAWTSPMTSPLDFSDDIPFALPLLLKACKRGLLARVAGRRRRQGGPGGRAPQVRRPRRGLDRDQAAGGSRWVVGPCRLDGWFDPAALRFRGALGALRIVPAD